MKHIELPVPEIVGIAITRGLLGAGLALLLGERLTPRKRRRLGIIFTAIGVLSTPALAFDFIRYRYRRAR